MIVIPGFYSVHKLNNCSILKFLSYLIMIEGSSTFNFPSLFQIRIGCVSSEGQKLGFSPHELQIGESEVSFQGTWWAYKKDVLPKKILLHHPTQVL